jgi:hypothetical protein
VIPVVAGSRRKAAGTCAEGSDLFTVGLRENVFALYAGLISSGYDLFELAADDPVHIVIEEIRRMQWPEPVTAYFAKARKEGGGVNPYWPRAAMLLMVSFYAESSHNQGLPCVSCHTDGTCGSAAVQVQELTSEKEWKMSVKAQLDRFPVSPEAKSSGVFEWLLGFADIWHQMRSLDSFARLWTKYRTVMDSSIDQFYETTRDSIRLFTNVLGVAPQGLPAICVIPNPLQAPQVADFVRKDGVVYVIVAAPRPSAIIHELLHDVFEPGIEAAKHKIAQFSHLLEPVYGQMVKMQYAWDMSPDSWLRVFEENFMRAASIWVEHAPGMPGADSKEDAPARAHAHALTHAQEGFVYVPVMVTMFLKEWHGLDGIGVFMDKVLEVCDSLDSLRHLP